MNNAISGLIDDAFIEDAAQMRLQCESAHNIRKKRSVLIAALAACLVLILAAIPAVIKSGKKEPVPYSYIADIPETVRSGSMTWSRTHRGSIGSTYSEDLDAQQILEFFALSDISELEKYVGELESMSGDVKYESWGEVLDIRVELRFVGGKHISMIIDPKGVLHNDDPNSELVTAEVGEFTVLRINYYRIFNPMGEPAEGSGYSTVIQMRKEGARIWALADIYKRDGEKLELVYNFLLNAEYDFAALEEPGTTHLDYYDPYNTLSKTYIENESLPESEYIRTPEDGYTVKAVDGDEIRELFKNTDPLIQELFSQTRQALDGNVTYTPDGDVHSVYLRLWFLFGDEKKYIGVIIDPNAKLDLSEKQTEKLNGCELYTDIYCERTELGYGSVGISYDSILNYIQKDEIGIQIRSNGQETSALLVKLINFIVYSEIDFDALKK